MSTDQLVAEAARILIPALPYLVKGLKIGGKKAAEKLGELGADLSFERAKKVWDALQRGKPSRKLEIAAKELAETPQDKAWQKMMNDELKLLLKADPALAKTVAEFLTAGVPEQSVRAVKNKNSRISQSIKKTGKQKVNAVENSGLVIRQSIDGKD